MTYDLSRLTSLLLNLNPQHRHGEDCLIGAGTMAELQALASRLKRGMEEARENSLGRGSLHFSEVKTDGSIGLTIEATGTDEQLEQLVKVAGLKHYSIDRSDGSSISVHPEDVRSLNESQWGDSY